MAEVGRSREESEMEQETNAQRARREKSLLDWEVVAGGGRKEGEGVRKKKKGGWGVGGVGGGGEISVIKEP